jgi:hypothetical protein
MSASTSAVPAALSADKPCPKLATMKQMSWSELMTMARDLHPEEAQNAFRSTVQCFFHHEGLTLQDIVKIQESTAVVHMLAELLYNRKGQILAESYRCNEMTRLQLEYEVLRLRLCTQETLPTDDFELKVLLSREMSRLLNGDFPQETNGQETNEEDPDDMETDEDGLNEEETDEEYSDDDSNDGRHTPEGHLIVSRWVPSLRRSVRMAF